MEGNWYPPRVVKLPTKRVAPVVQPPKPSSSRMLGALLVFVGLELLAVLVAFAWWVAK